MQQIASFNALRPGVADTPTNKRMLLDLLKGEMHGRAFHPACVLSMADQPRRERYYSLPPSRLGRQSLLGDRGGRALRALSVTYHDGMV